MTSTEETVEIPVELKDAAAVAVAEQPTFATLLNPEETLWGGEDAPGMHLLVVEPEVTGILNTATGRFVPDDPEQVRVLLVQRLTDTIGATPVEGGAKPRVVDWSTLEVIDEGGGTVTATATSEPDPSESDAVYAMQVELDLALQPRVTAEQLVSGGAFEEAIAEAIEQREAELTQFAEKVAQPEEPAPTVEPEQSTEAAAIDGAYLGGHYTTTAFPFEDNEFVFDWDTWTHDQTTPDGLTGFTATATGTDNRGYDTYAWFDPATGITIVRAEPQAEAEAAAPQESTVDGDYLGGHYGTTAFPFEDNEFVFDWDTWTHDQTTPDGLTGFTATATGTDNRGYDTYAWFDPATGITIVRAELQAAGEEGAGAEEQVDPQVQFEESIMEQLREQWRGCDFRLEELGGKVYDVRGWVEGESGYELTYDSFDGEDYLAELAAVTEDGEPVTCLLRVRDPETVWVDREEARTMP